MLSWDEFDAEEVPSTTTATRGVAGVQARAQIQAEEARVAAPAVTERARLHWNRLPSLRQPPHVLKPPLLRLPLWRLQRQRRAWRSIRCNKPSPRWRPWM